MPGDGHTAVCHARGAGRRRRGATPKQFGGIALLILLGIQSVLLLIAGAGWVRRAVQRDFSSNMIDSHRLTPMTGWTAVFGYIIGRT